MFKLLEKIKNYFFPEMGKTFFDKSTNTFYFQTKKGELKYPVKITDQDIDRWRKEAKQEKI